MARSGRRIAARRPAGVRGGRRPAARADGQLRGRTPEPRRGPAGAARPAADRRRAPRRLVRRSARAAARVRAARARNPAAACTSSASSAREASTPTTATWSRSPTSPAGAGSPRSACTRCSMAATRRLARPTGSCRTSSGDSPPSIRTRGSRRSAAATTAWTATTAGNGPPPAYDAIVHGVGEHAPSAEAAIALALRARRERRVRPSDGDRRRRRAVMRRRRRRDPLQLPRRPRAPAHPRARRSRVQRLRPDRARAVPRDLLVVTLTAYEAGLPVEVAFPPEEAHSLAAELSAHGWRQFHVAETEKYAHVTYFFNGGREAPWPGEDRLLVPSQKVATYDLAPEMAAAGVTDALVDAIAVGRLRLHRRELRQRGHGRPHGDLGRRPSAPSRRSTPASARVVAAIDDVEARDPDGPGAALLDHGRPRQRRRDARRGRATR